MTFPHTGRRAAARSRAAVRGHRIRSPFSSEAFRAAVATVPSARDLLPRRSVLVLLGLGFVGAMVVSSSVPALAVSAADTTASVYAPAEYSGDTVELAPQTVEVASDVVMPAAVAGASSYAVEAAPPPIVSQVASVGSVSLIESERIVWPVLTPERQSDGFGPRSAPCAGCSTNHDGVDFNPGNGSPVMAIADGVVVLATENSGGLGVNIEVQHNIAGTLVTSSYAHMQSGSMTVGVGDHVTAGQQIGLVGTTGQSTGPHLHLEMFGTDGVRFDGFAWLAMRVTG
ncbi:Murein DD-endopeptidase MepM and murein hydrolase activator NlpD, contain LysM domain [Agromyces sp. CF514]|uniref:M23 family metallopeptidase n=1 Tax=Agromyces sp. CF514 TaxID=1881031 RepID=UPI0008E0016E|nr:M23 family metallopeptidase [Agromyces sp. CF514]SFR74348.1 Murein DD-endopeptidase MepM and murein hydrolase activator NlpD, contain LysM domain [Agromyces sp. CF514]